MLLQLEGREKQFVLDILKDCVCMFGRVMANDVEKGMKSFPGLRMKLNYFHKQLEAAKRWNTDEERVPVRPEWTTVDRILDTRNHGDVTEYLVKWKELGYDEATWEVKEDVAPFQTEVAKFKSIMARGKKRKGTTLDNKEPKRQRKDFKPFENTPKFLVGGKNAIKLCLERLGGQTLLFFRCDQSPF
jgi:chromodomain-helicase-DNA-binding protein 4